MTTLAIDTSASLCAAGIFAGEQELGRSVVEMSKGHAEHLMGIIDAALAAAGASYADLTRIVVAIGPGSFTGIRVGVATARGLGLALGIPVVGVSNLEAVAAEAGHDCKAVMAAFSSANDLVQVGVYEPFARTLHNPATMNAADALALAHHHQAVVTGSASALLNNLDPSIRTMPGSATADIAIFARLGALTAPGDRPKPLYLREPDAKPQASFVLPRAAS